MSASRCSAVPIIPSSSCGWNCPRGSSVTLPASSYAHIRQLVWVQSGSLVITEGGERHALAAGDCLGFGPPADTTFANETNAACVYVVALARS